MSSPKLRQLEHLMLLAEELHFARAAERAFLSQPAFSRSIQNLEETLGLRLVDRGPRFVRLTAVGERVAKRARRMISSSSDLSREVSMLRSGNIGDVDVGAGPFSGLTVVAASLAQLNKTYPGIRVRLDISNWVLLLQRLHEEKLDFFVAEIRELPPSEELLIEPLGALLGGLYCRPEHPLADRGEIGFNELKDARFASVHMPIAMRRTLGERFVADENGLFPLGLECDSIAVLREMALNSDLVLVSVEHAVRHDLAAGRLQRLNVRELAAFGNATPLATALGLVRLKARTPAPASELLMTQVREQAKQSLLPIAPA